MIKAQRSELKRRFYQPRASHSSSEQPIISCSSSLERLIALVILYNPAISRTSPDKFPPPPNIPHYPALSRTIPTILSNFDISGTPTIPTISPVAGRAEYHSHLAHSGSRRLYISAQGGWLAIIVGNPWEQL